MQRVTISDIGEESVYFMGIKWPSQKCLIEFLEHKLEEGANFLQPRKIRWGGYLGDIAEYIAEEVFQSSTDVRGGVVRDCRGKLQYMCVRFDRDIEEYNCINHLNLAELVENLSNLKYDWLECWNREMSAGRITLETNKTCVQDCEERFLEAIGNAFYRDTPENYSLIFQDGNEWVSEWLSMRP